ncbi:hypothetical protein V490_08474 [Pseudogymnoascus sp. VKM F-3557]|nr:hypothetical protein V490_08474 [Pseudogymnoascus sp. VKM F-3557]
MKTSRHPDQLEQDLTFDRPSDNLTSLYQPPPRNRSHPAIASHLIAIAIAIVLLLRRPASIASAQTIACLCVLILMQHTNKHQASTTTHTRPLDRPTPALYTAAKPNPSGSRSPGSGCLRDDERRVSCRTHYDGIREAIVCGGVRRSDETYIPASARSYRYSRTVGINPRADLGRGGKREVRHRSALAFAVAVFIVGDVDINKEATHHPPSPAHPAIKTRSPPIRPLSDTRSPVAASQARRQIGNTPFPFPDDGLRPGTTRGPGRSPAVACIEPAYLFQRCRRSSFCSVLSATRCRGTDAVLLYTTDSGGYVRTCRWAELGVWPAGTGTGRGGIGGGCVSQERDNTVYWTRQKVVLSLVLSSRTSSPNGSCSGEEKQGMHSTSQ